MLQPGTTCTAVLSCRYGLRRVVGTAVRVGVLTAVRDPVAGEGRTTLGAVTRVGVRLGSDTDGLLGCIVRLLGVGVIVRRCSVVGLMDDDVGVRGVAVGRGVVIRGWVTWGVRLVDVA